EKDGSEFRRERLEVVAERLPRTHRSRLQIPKDFREGPIARRAERPLRHLDEAGASNHPLLAAWTNLRPNSGHAPSVRKGSGHPPVRHLSDQHLPRLTTVEDADAAQGREATAGSQ